MSRQQTRTKGHEDRKEKRSPSELHDAAFRHFQSGRLGSAEDRCRQALALDPNHADSLHLLGLIHTQSGKFDTAIDLIAAAIKSNPNNAEYFSNFGTLLRRQNRFEEARKSYDLALKLAPSSASLWIKLGDLLRTQGQCDESLLTYDHALTLDSTSAEAANKSGSLLLELGRHEEALARFDLSHAILPDQVDVLRNRGTCLNRLGRLEEAVASYRKALELAPRDHEIHNELGLILFELRDFEDAIAQFRKAIQIEPDSIPALHNLGSTLLDLKRFDEALSAFDRALSIFPDQAEIINNKGRALMGLGRYEDALAHCDRAIALKPDYADSYCNRGVCLDELMRIDEALASYRRALTLQPDDSSTHWNLSLNRLRVGEFKTGWPEAEWRWKCPSLVLWKCNSERPLWLGVEPIRGKTILLYSDQGLGDALQFCRYVPMVAAMGAQVILQVQGELCELFSGLAGVSTIVSHGESLPSFDYQCSLSSLPLAFNTVLETIPSVTPYLSVDDQAEAWRVRLASITSPRVGLVWSGNPKHGNDRNRSIALEALLPLLEVKAAFVSLQKDVRSADRAVLDQRKEILDIGPELKSFVDTAAVVSQLDLVISVDTSVAHLAGALDRPVWILLPYVPDWRWLLHRTDSPWYPTARLFRQSETRDWRTVVQQVRTELDSLMLSLPMAPNNPKRAAK